MYFLWRFSGALEVCNALQTDLRGSLAGRAQTGTQFAPAGVVVDGEHLECDAVVIAMGPWASKASEWFATQFPIEGQKYHSIVMRPQQQISADMLFLNYRGPHGGWGLQMLRWLSSGLQPGALACFAHALPTFGDNFGCPHLSCAGAATFTVHSTEVCG